MRVAAERKLNSYRQLNSYTLTIRTFLFSPPLSAQAHACTASFCVFFFYRPTGRPRHGEFLRLLFLQAHRETEVHFTAAGMSSQRNHSFVSLQARGILPVAEEQSRTRGSQSGGVRINLNVEGCGIVAAPVHAPSRAPFLLPFLLSHNLPRSLVRDGQTSPHRLRLVVSRSTCPPLSPSPHSNSFIIGTAVINTHTHRELPGTVCRVPYPGRRRRGLDCTTAALQIPHSRARAPMRELG